MVDNVLVGCVEKFEFFGVFCCVSFWIDGFDGQEIVVDLLYYDVDCIGVQVGVCIDFVFDCEYVCVFLCVKE